MGNQVYIIMMPAALVFYIIEISGIIVNLVS